MWGQTKIKVQSYSGQILSPWIWIFLDALSLSIHPVNLLFLYVILKNTELNPSLPSNFYMKPSI